MSGNWIYGDELYEIQQRYNMYTEQGTKYINGLRSPKQANIFLAALHEVQSSNANVDFVMNYNYRKGEAYFNKVISLAMEKNQFFACEIFSVTLQQLIDFGWKQFEDNENKFIVKFNRILNKYDITDDASITMFMATMAHESNYGIDNIEGMINGEETLTADNWDEYIERVNPKSSMKFDERGAGYIQLSWGPSQDLFLNDIGAYEEMQNSGMDRVHFIAEHYSLEASAWFWATTNVKSTRVGSLNNYAKTYGNTEGIFLITQYFSNSYAAKQNDLEVVRDGGKYEITKENLIVNGSSNPLPINWEDRRKKYEEAYKIFGK